MELMSFAKPIRAELQKLLFLRAYLYVLTFTGVVLANKLKPKEKSSFVIRELTIENIEPDEKKPEPIPEPPRKQHPPQIQTEQTYSHSQL